MGRPDKRGAVKSRADQTLALTVNAEGDVNYDAIVRQGENRNRIIATGHKALVPKLDQLNSAMPKPGEEEAESTAKATAEALAARVTRKQAAVNPKSVPSAPGAAEYIKYTPASASSAHASGSSTRIIKMQEMPIDPLEPPKFRHVKVPRGPGSPPVPVMHSPPRALTAKDQQDWKIPPCVSNWKNAKGYTIPLDKRLAADGRGLQEVSINDQFAKFTEALYIAEQKARSAVETRAKMQRELLAREKERKEVELRELAMQARLDRMGGRAPPASARDSDRPVDASPTGEERREIPTAGQVDHPGAQDSYRPRRGRDDDDGDYHGREKRYDRSGGDNDASSDEYRETREEREERRRRDEIREDRRRERERERRLEARDAHGYKRSKLTRDKDRDISEKIALGMAKVTGGEAMYDQRLFNQETGLDTGLASEDAYNIYDKPLFTDRSALFRRQGGRHDESAGELRDEEIDTGKFKPDKGFSGVDYGRGQARGGDVEGGRSDGLQFEKDPADVEADPFGLDAFLSDVHEGRRRPLDKIGKNGGMAAAGGGRAGGYDDHASGSGRGSGRRMEFTSGDN